LFVFNDEWLFAIGGFNKNHELTNTIERLNIQNDLPTNWQTLKVVIPSVTSNPGAIQVSLKEIVVFGGWDNNTLKTSFMIR